MSVMEFDELLNTMMRVRRTMKSRMEYLDVLQARYLAVLSEKDKLNASARKAVQLISDPSVPQALKELIKKEVLSKHEELLKKEEDYLAILFALKELARR
jgi:hypothetical protein